MPQKTTWCLMMRIRAEMYKDNVLLKGIVQADETYIGGKSRKDYDRELYRLSFTHHSIKKKWTDVKLSFS